MVIYPQEIIINITHNSFRDRMSLKSRGRSPGGSGGQPRQAELSGRGASLGPGHAGEQ